MFISLYYKNYLLQKLFHAHILSLLFRMILVISDKKFIDVRIHKY